MGVKYSSIFTNAEIVKGQKVVFLCKEEDKEKFEEVFRGNIQWTLMYSDEYLFWQGVVNPNDLQP